MRTMLLALGWMGASGLLACTPGANQEAPLERQRQGIGVADRLSADEWAAYAANRRYIHDRVKADVRVRLNYADPRQYDFAMARLKLAGKTAENSPHLFELIETRREEQIASGLKAGAFAEIADELPGAQRREMHWIESASIGASGEGQSAAAGQVVATVGSTFPGGSIYTYLDVSIAGLSGLPIGPLDYNEEFEEGEDVVASTSGDPSVTTSKGYAIETYKFEDFVTEEGEPGFTDSYTRTEVGILTPQPRAGLPLLSTPLILEPADRKGPFDGPPDGIISICIDRTWTHDCDRVLTQGRDGEKKIEMPLKGSVSVLSAHAFDRNKIDQLKSQLLSGRNPPEAGSLKLVLSNVGGGCDVTDGDALYAKMLMFWNRVSISADNRTLSWDLTGANVAFFDKGCRQRQDRAKLTARIPLPLLATPSGESSTVSITITSDARVSRPEALLPPITLTNSCLAEGTQIEVGNGASAPIESLAIGRSVFSPFAGEARSLTITDTAQGVEIAPMVRIRDESGRSLLLTEMHPVATPDRGMVQARALRAGDRVLTRDGQSELVEVGREAYSGKVYNLKVGSSAELAALGPDQTVVHANGFVVGDGQIQSKYEALADKQASGAREVPARWQRDYLQSRDRK